MRDVLENKRDSTSLSLGLKQWVWQLVQIMITLEMVPGRRITIRDRGGLDDLTTLHTSFALESLVRITAFCLGIKLEQLSEVLLRKMTFHVLILVHDTRRKRLFVGLALKDLFLD